MKTACYNCVESAKLLLERDDINVNIRDRDGWTALHYACYEESLEVVELLLERDDINPNLQNNSGKTALSEAADSNGIIRCVKLLLERDDINVNIPDMDGRTALHYACSRGSLEIESLLRAAGAI